MLQVYIFEVIVFTLQIEQCTEMERLSPQLPSGHWRHWRLWSPQASMPQRLWTDPQGDNLSVSVLSNAKTLIWEYRRLAVGHHHVSHYWWQEISTMIWKDWWSCNLLLWIQINCPFVSSTMPIGAIHYIDNMFYLGSKWTHFQCVSNGVTSVLHTNGTNHEYNQYSINFVDDKPNACTKFNLVDLLQLIVFIRLTEGLRSKSRAICIRPVTSGRWSPSSTPHKSGRGGRLPHGASSMFGWV